MKQPEVSIVIPAYNAAKFLPTAVESVLAQTFSNWELIIVNDGSKDSTLSVAQRFSDPRIRVVDQPNQGVSAARNRGIADARGELIRFLDADDALEKENLALLRANLRDRRMDWVFGDILLCDEALTPTGEVWIGTDSNTLRTLLLQQERAVPGAGSNLLVHRRCIEQGIKFDVQLSNAADQDISMQLAGRFEGCRVPGAYTYYRNVQASMSKNVAVYERDHLYLFRKAKANGLLKEGKFRRACMANVYWAIGGSWWLLAGARLRAIPWFIKATWLNPKVLIRPINKRLAGRRDRNEGAGPKADAVLAKKTGQ